MSIELITILLFGSMLILLILGQPVAFALGGLAVISVFTLWSPQAVSVVVHNVWAKMFDFTLIAIPLFIFMANVLRGSGVADALYEMMYRWFGQVRGGLAIGTVIICTIFAAMSGISGAATVTMGLIALPSMLKRHYRKEMAIGCISAGGALGVLIPPSVLMIVLALLGGLSVGRLFAAGIMPGVILSSLFIAYILVRSLLQPQMAPALPVEARVGWKAKLVSTRAVILPVILVLAVLGSIFSGLASPSEAAGVGAFGSIICAAVHRRLNWPSFKEASLDSLRITGMAMWIIFGAVSFAAVYDGLGAMDLIKGLLLGLPGGRWGVLIAILVTYMVLGCFLDSFGIMAITAPLYFPIIRSLGFDPLWFGVLYMMTVEMAYLTPPFGFNLFYMKGVVPKGITMGDIYRSIVPFVGLQFIGLIIVLLFPVVATWLPGLIFKPLG